MPEITVYGKPGCQQCHITRRALDKARLPYTYHDVSIDEAAHEVVTALGYQTLPVVTAGDMHWSGFRAGQLRLLAEIYPEAPDIAGFDMEAVEYLAGVSDA